MKFNYIIIQIFIVYTISKDEFLYDKNILSLTDENFNQALEQYTNILVLFYSPFSEEYKKFIPEYQKAGAILKKENLYLAKIDCTKETKLLQKYKIEYLPVLKLFSGNQIKEYKGGIKFKDIINFMRKNINNESIIYIKDVKDIKNVIDENIIVLIYYGSNKNDIFEFEKISKKYEDYTFAVVQPEKIIKKYTKPGTIILYNNSIKEKKIEFFDQINEKNLEKFIQKNILLKVLDFNDKSAQLIFGRKNPALILFLDEKHKRKEKIEKLMDKISFNLLNQSFFEIKLIISDHHNKISKKLCDYIGIKSEELPKIFILNFKKDFQKYEMQDEINEENIMNFIQKWRGGGLKLHLKSGNIPNNNKGNVLILVGNTYQKEVLKNDKDIMVFFYVPNCNHCQTFNLKYEKIAKRIKNKNKNIIFAKIDMKENEIENLVINSFPSIKFYPGNKKDNPPIDFVGERNFDDIFDFIKKNAFHKIESDKEDIINDL